MAGLKFTILCITAVCWGSVLSAITTWKKSMTTCRNIDQLPSSEEDTKKNGSWVGKVKYSFQWGTGILQIERVDKNETCSDCDAQTKQCEFCDIRLQLNGSVAWLEVFRTLKPRRKYILAEFRKQNISGIPPPTQCMVHRGASHNEYVSCSEKFDDGCKDSGDDISGTYITICFDVYATTQADVNFSGCTSQQDNNVNKDAPVDKASSEEKEGLSVIAVAYIITVPLLICVSIAVNFVCYKCGFKKGKTAERKHQLQQFPDDTQTVHYQHYQGDDENVQRAAREQPGPSAGQVSTDASHDYAAYDEIKEQRQRIQTSQRKKDGGYLTPVSQNVNRSLPAVRTDGDGYMSPASATDNRPAGQGKRNSPSPPGNGGYISPLQAENVAERLVSSNSDSSSNKSDKSDKSRKYQNEPRSKPSPTSKSIYQSIKDTGITPEHQYIELKTSAS